MLYEKVILDTIEKDISDDFESGALRSVKNVKAEKARYKKYAESAMQKTESINVQIFASFFHAGAGL